VGGEERGELVVWLVKFACVKAGLLHGWPGSHGSAKVEGKKEMPIMVIGC